LLEGRPRREILLRKLLERPHVDQQPVITDVFERIQRRRRVGYGQPAALQM
jgi:hypothetical protein